MRTANVSGSISMSRRSRRSSGRSALPSERVSATGDQRRVDVRAGRRGRRRAPPGATQVIARPGATAGAAPNIGRGSMRLRASGSRRWRRPSAPTRSSRPSAPACGRTPKNAGSHSTRSASLPTSTEPTSALRARGRSPGRSCTSRRSGGPAGCRRRRRRRARPGAASSRARSATCAGPPRRCGPSPASPSRSSRSRRGRGGCPRRRSSTVGSRLSAKARSSGTDGLRWWHTINMSRCSSTVFTVCGRVGLVDDGSTFGCGRHRDDVGRVAAARALGVVRVDRPPGDGGERALHVAGLVERVGVDRHLHARRVGDAQAGVDRRRRRPPVLVQLEPRQRRPRSCSHIAASSTGVALAEQGDVDRPVVERLEHPLEVPRAG